MLLKSTLMPSSNIRFRDYAQDLQQDFVLFLIGLWGNRFFAPISSSRNPSIGSDGTVETYLGQYEAIYSNMLVFGLGKASKHISAIEEAKILQPFLHLSKMRENQFNLCKKR